MSGWPNYDGEEINLMMDDLKRDVLNDIVAYASKEGISIEWLMKGLDDAPVVVWAQDVLDMSADYGWYNPAMIALCEPEYLKEVF